MPNNMVVKEFCKVWKDELLNLCMGDYLATLYWRNNSTRIVSSSNNTYFRNISQDFDTKTTGVYPGYLIMVGISWAGIWAIFWKLLECWFDKQNLRYGEFVTFDNVSYGILKQAQKHVLSQYLRYRNDRAIWQGLRAACQTAVCGFIMEEDTLWTWYRMPVWNQRQKIFWP